jgi:hypothetical protein
MFFTTFSYYYVFRSRLETRSEFPFKSSHKLSSSEQHIHLPDFLFYPYTYLYASLYFIFFQIHLLPVRFSEAAQ